VTGKKMFRGWRFLVIALGALSVLVDAASAATAYIATGPSRKTLQFFDTATPGVILGNIVITGTPAADFLVDIDFRPSNGQLYAITIDNTVFPPLIRLYRVALPSGAATQVGADVVQYEVLVGQVMFYGSNYTLDFDPVTDVARVVDPTGHNFRLDPDTGALLGPDTALNPFGGVYATAHTNNFAGASATTLFGIRASQAGPALLVRIGDLGGAPSPPSAGVVTEIGPLGLASAVQDLMGFDVTADGSVFFAAIPDQARFYQVNLQTGAATEIGPIGGDPFFRGLAVAPVGMSEIPTVSEVGLLALGLALALLAARRLAQARA
jgi:hypothetical protein